MYTEVDMSREEMIKSMVDSWIDDAAFDSILEYCAQKLSEWYDDLNDAEVLEMYKSDDHATLEIEATLFPTGKELNA